jgi:hypothetical protein
MQFAINTTTAHPGEVRIGNVYPIRGGHGRRAGHLMILMAITEPLNSYQSESCLMFIVDNQGRPRGVTSYAIHALEERAVVGFVDGLEDLTFEIRSL